MNDSENLDFLALNTLKNSYTKLLLVNLSTRIFSIIVVTDPREQDYLKLCNDVNNIDTYWEWFLYSNFIHPEDVDKVRNFFSKDKPYNSITYRRRANSSSQECATYCYTYMELIPTKDYSDDNKECIVYVKNVDDIYSYEETLVIERTKRIDSMTGLLNNMAFTADIHRPSKGNVGVAFIDVNALKWTNDNLGHKQGDELILKVADLLKNQFPAYSIYRTGGDEFVVVAFNVKLRVFIHTVVAFHKRIWNEYEKPLVSIGYSADSVTDIDEIVEDAERQMYEDKSIFYKKFPQYKR